MRIADSRVMGLLPLQHSGYKEKLWDLDLRSSIFGIRILDRLDKAGDAGHWLYDPESVGDIHGGQLFKQQPGQRPIPMWRFATGVVVTRSNDVATVDPKQPGGGSVATPGAGRPPVATPGGGSPSGNAGAAPVETGTSDRPVGGDLPLDSGSVGTQVATGTEASNTPPSSGPGQTTTGPGTGNSPTEPGNPGTTTTGGAAGTSIPATCRPLIGGMNVAPILDENYGPDLRLKPIKPAIYKRGGKVAMSKPPVGYLGITLTGNEENRQVDLFFPTDSRLISVNYGGDVLCGSLVCDLTPDSELDPDRTAPLQALTWVIKHPNGDPNTLAWNIGPTGCQDTHGGYVIDDADGGGRPNAPVDAKIGGTGSPRLAHPPVASGPSTGVTSSQLTGTGALPTEVKGSNGAKPGGSKKSKIVSRVNKRFKGPFDVGSGHCLHFTGESDDDDHLIGPLHIQHQFLLRENDAHCGPLNISTWQPGSDFDRPTIVRMGWNPFIRKWDWWSTSPIYYVPVPPCPPTPLTPVPWSPMVWLPFQPQNPQIPTPTPIKPKVGEVKVATPDGPIKLGDMFGLGTGVLSGTVPIEPGSLNGAGNTGQPVPGKPPQPGASGSTPKGPGTDNPTQDRPDTPQTPAAFPGAPDPDEVRRLLSGQALLLQPQNVGGNSSLMSNTPRMASNLPFLLAEAAMGTPGGMLLATALNYSHGKPNNMGGLLDPSQQTAAGPVSGSMAAFAGEGGQTGAGGYLHSTGAQGDPWVYNKMPGKGKYATGTGPGGWCFMPPEVDLQYARNYGMVPPNEALSSCYVMVAPGAYFAAGVPELGDGTMKDGYVWGMESSTGDLVWYTHSNSQAKIEAMRFSLTAQNISWRSGTSFNGILDHANTGNRTYTFPDYSAPVALMVTGASDPSGVVTAPESTMYWDTATETLYVNNNSGTAWSAISGGGGGSITGSGTAGQVTFWTSATNITSDAGLTYSSSSDTLTIQGPGSLFSYVPLSVKHTAATFIGNTIFIPFSLLNSSSSDTTAIEFALKFGDTTAGAETGSFQVLTCEGGAYGSRLMIYGSNVVLNSAAISTSATDGFLYVAGCAGVPTGTPTTFTGRDPIVIDHTNNTLYFYSNGAWRAASGGGSGGAGDTTFIEQIETGGVFDSISASFVAVTGTDISFTMAETKAVRISYEFTGYRNFADTDLTALYGIYINGTVYEKGSLKLSLVSGANGQWTAHVEKMITLTAGSQLVKLMLKSDGTHNSHILSDSDNPTYSTVSYFSGGGGGPGTDTTAFHDGGDTFGAAATIGTNDNFNLIIERNNSTVGTWKAAALELPAAYNLYLGTSADVYGANSDIIAASSATGTTISQKFTNTNAATTYHAISNEANNVEYGIVGTTYSPTDAMPITGGDGFVGFSRFGGLSGTPRRMWVYNKYNQSIIFSTNLLNRMELLGGGALCINSTAIISAEKLRVDGDVYFDGAMRWDKTNARLGIRNTSPAYALDVATASANTQIRFGSDNNDSGGYLLSTQSSQGIITGGMQFDGTNWKARSTGASTTVMHHTAAGDWAIMNGTGLTPGNTFSPSTRVYMDTGGKVNIGNGTNTSARLDILDTSVAQLRLTYTNTSVYNEFQTGSDGKLTFTSAGSLKGFAFAGNYRFTHGTSALATNATEGFLMIQSCAGTPTGVPAAIPTGQVPIVYDTTNDKLYVYNGGWKRAQVGGIDAVWA